MPSYNYSIVSCASDSGAAPPKYDEDYLVTVVVGATENEDPGSFQSSSLAISAVFGAMGDMGTNWSYYSDIERTNLISSYTGPTTVYVKINNPAFMTAADDGSTWSITFEDSDSLEACTIDNASEGVIACFVAGTPVMVDGSDTPQLIEDISSMNTIGGVRVCALLSTLTPVGWSGLVRIRKGAIGPNVPSVDTVCTRWHLIDCSRGKSMRAEKLVNGTSITWEPVNTEPKRLFHILMENHEWVWLSINGMRAESLHPDHTMAIAERKRQGIIQHYKPLSADATSPLPSIASFNTVCTFVC